MDHDCGGSLVCYNCLHSINSCNFPLLLKHVLRRQLRMDHDCCGSLVCYNCLNAINNCNFPLMLKHVLRRQLRMESRLFWFPSLLQLFTCYKLGIPIDRVPTSKSCVFCLGIKFLFFPHLTVSWSLPVARIIFLKRCYACNILWGSWGESLPRFSLVALQTCM